MYNSLAPTILDWFHAKSTLIMLPSATQLPFLSFIFTILKICILTQFKIVLDALKEVKGIRIDFLKSSWPEVIITRAWAVHTTCFRFLTCDGAGVTFPPEQGEWSVRKHFFTQRYFSIWIWGSVPALTATDTTVVTATSNPAATPGSSTPLTQLGNWLVQKKNANEIWTTNYKNSKLN